jgi:hypothetical protein
MSKALSMKEYSDLICLEYVLTWNYSDAPKKDEKRYKKLSKRKWKHGLGFDWKDYFKKYYKPINHSPISS